MTTADPQVTATTATPCCGAPVTLAASEFVRPGRPRSGDTTVIYNIRCDGCGRWHAVVAETPVRYQRAESSTRYETRRRRIVGITWTEPVTS